MGTTLELANRVTGMKSEDIPQEVIEKAKELLLNFVGICLAGSETFTGKAITKYVNDMGAKPESTVIGGGFKTVAPYAAYATATLCHCVEMEDVGMRGSFAAAPLLAVALATGEKLDASGREILEGYILGHEIQGRVSIACLPASSKRVAPWKFGFLGAAAVAGRMMKLDADRLAMAIGLAASQAAGLAPTTGTKSHYLDFRSAARSGIESAILAQQGITARQDILEGQYCFCDELVGPGDYSLAQMTQDWGKSFQALQVSIKKYPACYFSHRSLDTLLELLRDNKVSYKDVESVDLDTGLLTVRYMRFDEPKNADEARFSLKHVLGTAILKGDVWLDSFTDAAASDPRYREAQQKVRIIVHPEWPSGRDAMKTIVTLKLNDGRVFKRESGELREPTRREVLANFRRLTGPFLTPAQQQRSADILLNLENTKSVTELMDILRLKR